MGCYNGYGISYGIVEICQITSRPDVIKEIVGMQLATPLTLLPHLHQPA